MVASGAKLPPVACPACGTENPPDARFCKQCGGRVAPSDETPGPTGGTSTAAPTSPAPSTDGANAWDLASIDVRPPRGTSPPEAVASALQASGPGSTQEALAQAGLGGGRRKGGRLLLVLGAVGLFLAGVGIGVAALLLTREPGAPSDDEVLRIDDVDVSDPSLPEGHPPPDGDLDLVTGAPFDPVPEPDGAARPTTGRQAGGRPARSGHRHDEEPPVTTVDFRSGGSPTTGTARPTSRPSGSRSAQGAGGRTSGHERRGGASDTGGTGSTGRGTTTAGSGTGTGTSSRGTQGGRGATGSGAGSSGSAGSSATGTGAGSGSGGSGTSSGSAGSGTSGSDAERLRRAQGGGAIPSADRLYARKVRFVFQRYWAARARTCFSQATRNREQLGGRIVLRMTIDGRGQVSSARTVSNTTGDDGIGRCLEHRAKRWRFPPPPGGETTAVDLPLTAR